MSALKKHVYFLFSAMLMMSCHTQPVKEEKNPVARSAPLFALLPPERTGIDFKNTLEEGLNTNVLMYEYFYNGGGVAVGDINGDGLDDIYFTANMTSNRLYLNKGNMKFEDITTIAGVAGREGPWKTGVTMADVNGDNLLDIYVCYSGNVRPENRTKELYINKGPGENGIPVFSEEAKLYGLDIPVSATQAVFFDYDNDSDLDAFLLDHNIKALPELNETATADLLKKTDAVSGVRLLKNTNGKFTDITSGTGLNSSALSYGLGAGVADINQDGYTDIYVSNDYNVPDFLYINNGNGTFTDRLRDYIGHTSQFSMGNDVADINNDALPDIFTLDMLPEDNRRQKLLLSPDNYGKFELNLRVGFYYQYMRNMLHINTGNNTFSEVGQIAGISNTDWSWASLFADYDNDGWKDLYVTNGYLRDYTNMDFIKYMDNYVKQKGRLKREDVLDLVHQIPASNVVNYIFRNDGGYTFTNTTADWGMRQPSNSNGAAYADLDNDGDLDLVVNNINQPAFIYQNQANKQLKHYYLKIKLTGKGKNTLGVGARVTVYTGARKLYAEQMPTRGYQSSVSPVLHFGLGEASMADSISIQWPGGYSQMLAGVKASQQITLREADATSKKTSPRRPRQAMFQETNTPLAFQHLRVAVNDFKRQPLMVNPMSFNGGCLVKGDANGDGQEDIYAGGAAGQAGELWIQQHGRFVKKVQPAFEADRNSDDTDAVFFDANDDGHADLYVCSGGYHNFEPEDVLLQDRLYINDGKGNFVRNVAALPVMFTSTSCVRVSDLNDDGHPDLFVGGRVIPGRYPEPPRSYLLMNNGRGEFQDITGKLAPEIRNAGMVTDARWLDLNNDKKEDLVIAGEWMPVRVFINHDGALTDQTTDYFDKKYTGWWNTIAMGDFNKDGNTDLVVGNLGLNSPCKATDGEPTEMFYKDFDKNGSVDPVLCTYIAGKSYPYVSRDELLDQLPYLKKRFPDYKSFADATLSDIFRGDEMQGAVHLSANTLRTTYFERTANGKFSEKPLPLPVQHSPVYTITTLDYNNDGNEDLLFCGNINKARLRFGKYDANEGLVLKNNGKGDFAYVPQPESGLKLKGDVRSVVRMNNTLLFGINGDKVKAYRYFPGREDLPWDEHFLTGIIKKIKIISIMEINDNHASRRNALKKMVAATGAAAAMSMSHRVEAAEAVLAQDLKGKVNHSVCRWCYKDIPLEDLCKAAKDIGLASVELVGPEEWPVLKKYGLTSALPWGAGKGINDGFNNPQLHDELVASYEAIIPKVAAAGYNQIICFSGNRKGLDDEKGIENCAVGLKRLMSIAEKYKVTMVMELLNSKVNHKDYQCDHTAWGVALCDKVGSESFKLLYDIYHMQIMEGDVIATIRKYNKYISHYHTGGVPGRNEIDQTQELNYPAIMKAIVETGFKGFVAQEFVPKRDDKIASLKQGVQICDVV